ncbi:MAG: group II intron maturase-specific domain-containing protein [Candidatus Zhuqueibacterota bacterium]
MEPAPILSLPDPATTHPAQRRRAITVPVSFDERIARLNLLQAGWINYFKLANMYGKLRDIDVWVRRRLRGCIWSRTCGRRNQTVR